MPTKRDETITSSCGCVFCDLDLEPEMVGGKRMHMVDQDAYGTMRAVLCTKPITAAACVQDWR